MIVVSGERIKGAKLHPSTAQVFVRTLIKATNIWTHHLHPKNLEEKIAIYGGFEKIPVSNVVSSPMSSKQSTPNTVASGKDEGSSKSGQEFKGRYSSQVSIVGMNFCMKKWLFWSRIVLNVDVDGHRVDIFLFLYGIWFKDFVSASEVGWFIHIQPDSWELDFLIEFAELGLPKGRGVRVQKVNIIDFSRPNLSLIVILFVRMAPQKDVHVFAQFGCLTVVDSYGHIQ